MSDAGMFAVIGIIVVFIFANVVELICINDELKRLDHLVEDLNIKQQHNEVMEDFLFEKIRDLINETRKIKGQIFTVDEEGEK